LLAVVWLGAAAPPIPAVELGPRGPEVRLAPGAAPQRAVLALQPAGNYVIAWNDLPASVFLQHVEDGAEPAQEGPAAVWTGATPVVDAVTATPAGFELQWHILNSSYETIAF